MQDKNTLINSMTNLINHISISRRNQQQMFASLSRKDFDKIISNLDDSLQKLRITTVKLLTELLFANENLKHRFCDLMAIHCYDNSNIVLTGTLQKLVEKYPRKEIELFLLMKQHARALRDGLYDPRNKQPLLWFINLRNAKLEIQYMQREEFTLTGNIGIRSGFDPLDCVFGVSVYTQQQQPVDIKSATSLAQTSDISKSININIGHKSQQIPMANSGKSIHYQPVYIPIPMKSTFSKQGGQKVGNYSFVSGAQHPPYEIKNSFRESHKAGEVNLNLSYDQPSINLNSSFNMPSPASKRQYEQKKENEKYSNRLSLQFNDFKVKKSQQLEPDPKAIYTDRVRIEHQTQPSDHHPGIKILTPRQSFRQGQKFPTSGPTEWMSTERQNTTNSFVQREKTTESMTESGQKIKTIQLGGFRGLDSLRDKRNPKIQRH